MNIDLKKAEIAGCLKFKDIKSGTVGQTMDRKGLVRTGLERQERRGMDRGASEGRGVEPKAMAPNGRKREVLRAEERHR